MPALNVCVEADKANTLSANPPLNLSSKYHRDTLLEETVGTQQDFWTFNFGSNEYERYRATLLAVGDYCYIFLDNITIESLGQNYALEECEIYAKEFDRIIYPRNYDLMGPPEGNLGDIDGDPKITVFLCSAPYSYYWQLNELSGYENSNNREMVYVSYHSNKESVIKTMCHETNHLFLFNNDFDEAVFFTEGLAEFSTYYAGYMNNESFMYPQMKLNNTASSIHFSIYPDTSLFFFDELYHVSASYGFGYMLLLYISEHYGIETIKDLISVELDGPEAIEYVLSDNGYNISFNELYLNFIIACTVDITGIENDLYGFTTTEFQISTKTEIDNLPFTLNNINHRYYGINLLELVSPPDEFSLRILTPEYPRSLGISIAISDKNGWNFTQQIYTEDGESIQIFFKGEEITSAYIVTSMIKEGTPVPQRYWGVSPISEINLTIAEGHDIISESAFFIFPMFLCLITYCINRKVLLNKKNLKTF